ncbi:MAG: hypothetical protein A3F26_02620 [Candidatus Ryanbacteria bacterium RIFCSPHIGHO2_12_FULL_47_12b]|nr:MAG: hypothetical protein UX74_C0018G0009 [Parcubacteria group bacterium GW2011_GWA2_47_10b]OGZ48393.1 MAG: hypothetical protein A3C83_03280 [Candidatus Ryanbacteria bacterium RIFCSPHIGHO2_02_FULL_47_25]OGZ52138.1 MAG: hypothetical protein A3F26_02620 [Candidatus Ryanbacteria bacterium RIFCSPHIGHO2_12_FULL_47_12b]
MDENLAFLAILVVILFGFAFFANLSTSSGPLATPPNPDAEFGVVREQKSVFDVFEPPPPPPPTDDTTQTEDKTIESEKKEERYKQYFSISSANARSRNPDTEYIDIQYNPPENESVYISNWKIANKRGGSFRLGEVTNFPGTGTTPNSSPLIIPQGGIIHVITGRSPRGENFRLNKCAEYFQEHNEYIPSLSVSCPPPAQEPGQDGLNDECFDYVQGLWSCRLAEPPPVGFGDRCAEYVRETASYVGCVDNHRQDKDFFINEWWVYLNRPEQMWSDVRETITLSDERGIVIASESYD